MAEPASKLTDRTRNNLYLQRIRASSHLDQRPGKEVRYLLDRLDDLVAALEQAEKALQDRDEHVHELIGLFIEYRDKHGRTEDEARQAALAEWFQGIEALAVLDGQDRQEGR